ncbi:transcriptional repressor TraM [Notoacmeibacter sp. MSK16QG-6]|uniref:transcriptional repressor TraM n=1 Tax=Notoacmeibacter sp. MSK16QG-6 TaxID=2957982 RepID=UPI00209EDF92|nr:transcriptional repressor TraM [Notoacmeibacter sp. MSK16QG-6]MCP1201087.1 hypothetical protein [Notoacmeibacter sp. MSK16QG-6]
MSKEIKLRNASSPRLSIERILSNLTPTELEQLAIAVIRNQRERLEAAQTLYDRLDASRKGAHQDAADELVKHEYTLAMLMMTTHHQVTSAVIDKLGYVPTISGGETAH